MARTNRRSYPLRKILFREYIHDYLECGHKLPIPSDIIGTYYPERRRCHKCAKEKEPDFDVEEVKQ